MSPPSLSVQVYIGFNEMERSDVKTEVPFQDPLAVSHCHMAFLIGVVPTLIVHRCITAHFVA